MLNFIKVKITFVSMLIFTMLIFNAASLVAQKSLKIISPNGGEKLQANTWQGISWIYNDVDKINISYSVDGGNNWEVIERNINSEIGTISWKVPLLLNQNVKIKIEDTKGVIFDISDNYFTIIKEYSLKGSLQKISKINATYKILPLGNSITYDNRANDTRQVGDKKGYRDSLYNLLSNAGYNFVFKGSEHSGGNFLPAGYDNNAGFPGIKDDQLATLMKTGRRNQPQHGIDVQITPGPYLDIYPADIVLLHIGTNGNDAFDGTSADDVEEILDEIKRYEDSTNTSITVILARIIDRVPNATYVNTFNNNVEAMALDRVNNPSNDAYPDKIVMIDMQDSADINYTIDPFGTIGNGITGDMSDYLHPNDKGYAKMAEVWFNAITEILPGKPVIVEQPKSKSTIENSSVNFDVSVTGTSPFSYQWQKNGSDISGATQAILTLENISALDDSSKIKCIVSNSYGSVTSKEATLYVTGENDRVTVGLQALYTFEENDGIIIFDKSTKIPVLNLEIEDTTKSKWIPYGIKLTEPNLISSILQPQRIYDACTESNEITLEAWITPKNLTQTGPARIMSYSQDGDNRNFTLGQSGNKYSVRLRTTETNNNGQPELLTFSGLVDTTLSHIAFVRDSIGSAKFYVNGFEESSQTIAGDFSNWDSTYSFGFGNEFTTDRNWLGKYYLASLYSRALSAEEVLHNYSIGFNGQNNLLDKPTNLIAIIEEDTLVTLQWDDNSDEESGYMIERRANDVDSTYYLLGTVGADIIEFTDDYPKYLNSYIYRVKAYNGIYQSDFSDSIIVNEIVSDLEDEFLPTSFELYQNYPNPFNPTTTIKFSLDKRSIVTLQVYNTLGELIKTLIENKDFTSGIYSQEFNANKLPSGVYFYKLTANNFDESNSFQKIKKLILLK